MPPSFVALEIVESPVLSTRFCAKVSNLLSSGINNGNIKRDLKIPIEALEQLLYSFILLISLKERLLMLDRSNPKLVLFSLLEQANKNIISVKAKNFLII